jgi:hypothetical protein
LELDDGATLLLGLMTAPAFADMRLSLTGFIDNHIRYADNLTGDDLTDGSDDEWRARTRARLFFNVAANEYSKAIVGFEIDQVWGRQSGDSAVNASGFDFGNDNINVEVKWAYIDVRIPNTPVTLRMGGLPLKADQLKGSCFLLCMDVGGAEVEVALSPQLTASIYFAQTEEDDSLQAPDPTRLGDDYFGGVTLMTELVKGLKANVLFAYQHIGGPSLGGGSTSRITSTGEIREERFWIGAEAEWKLANLILSPTVIYGGGKREFATGGDIDLSTVMVDVRAAYILGPLTITGRFGYVPGNKQSDNLGAGGDDIHFWQSIAVDTVSRNVEWFEILGFNLDTTSTPMFGGGNDSRSLRSNGSFDQFGLVHGAARVDFQAAKPLTVTGAIGIFSAAEKVGPPSAGRSQGVTADRNYSGNDKYLGTELDFWLRYNLFKGTDVDVYFAYAFIGDALNLCALGTGAGTGVACDKSSADDIVTAGTRILYRF